MYYETGSLTALRIAQAHRQADLERSLRPDPFATSRTAAVAVIDTRAAGEPIAAPVVSATAGVELVASGATDCGTCRTADQAA